MASMSPVSATTADSSRSCWSWLGMAGVSTGGPGLSHAAQAGGSVVPAGRGLLRRSRLPPSPVERSLLRYFPLRSPRISGASSALRKAAGVGDGVGFAASARWDRNMADTELRIALLIDADNAPASRIEPILTELARHGVANVRRAYGNWKN